MKEEVLREVFNESTRLEHEDMWRKWITPCFIRIATMSTIAVYAILHDNGNYGIEPMVVAIGARCCAVCDSHKNWEFLYDVPDMLRAVVLDEGLVEGLGQALAEKCARGLARLNYINNFDSWYRARELDYVHGGRELGDLYNMTNEYVEALFGSLIVYSAVREYPIEPLMEGQGCWEKYGSLAELYEDSYGRYAIGMPSQEGLLADYRKATNTTRKPRIKTIRGLFWNSYPHKCAICGKEIESIHDMHVDHIIPLARGGEDVISNLQCVHSWCNLAKGASYSEGKR